MRKIWIVGDEEYRAEVFTQDEEEPTEYKIIAHCASMELAEEIVFAHNILIDIELQKEKFWDWYFNHRNDDLELSDWINPATREQDVKNAVRSISSVSLIEPVDYKNDGVL
mgnify:CR=1 FL=1